MNAEKPPYIRIYRNIDPSFIAAIKHVDRRNAGGRDGKSNYLASRDWYHRIERKWSCILCIRCKYVPANSFSSAIFMQHVSLSNWFFKLTRMWLTFVVLHVREVFKGSHRKMYNVGFSKLIKYSLSREKNLHSLHTILSVLREKPLRIVLQNVTLSRLILLARLTSGCKNFATASFNDVLRKMHANLWINRRYFDDANLCMPNIILLNYIIRRYNEISIRLFERFDLHTIKSHVYKIQ